MVMGGSGVQAPSCVVHHSGQQPEEPGAIGDLTSTSKKEARVSVGEAIHMVFKETPPHPVIAQSTMLGVELKGMSIPGIQS